MPSIVLAVFMYELALYVFCDFQGLHSSATVLGFQKSWWFRGFV